ncbi:hypothetical protein [Streptomyces mirabilis]|uniref:hypothetical protein n=1 Tax=Streptomyces mirabilis TaxID=68239 RepID=UPI0036D0E6AB
MWKTPAGVLVLPAVDTVGLRDTVTQRLATGGLVGALAARYTKFAADLAHGMPVKDLTARYSTLPLGDGRTLGDALAVLPPGASFDSAEAAVKAINTQEAAFLRSTVGAVSAVSALTGVTSEGAPLSQISVGTLARLLTDAPPGLGDALTVAGLDSPAELAAVPVDELIHRLDTARVTLSTAQAEELRGRASMITGMFNG